MHSSINKRVVNNSNDEPQLSDETPLLINSNQNENSSQFYKKSEDVPLKTIAMVILLFCIGSLSSLLSISFYFGNVSDTQKDEQWQSLAIIGVLCLIPGGYYFVYIILALFGVQGYYLSDIPSI